MVEALDGDNVIRGAQESPERDGQIDQWGLISKDGEWHWPFKPCPKYVPKRRDESHDYGKSQQWYDMYKYVCKNCDHPSGFHYLYPEGERKFLRIKEKPSACDWCFTLAGWE